MTHDDVLEFARNQKVALCAQLRSYLIFLSVASSCDPKLEEHFAVTLDALHRISAL